MTCAGRTPCKPSTVPDMQCHRIGGKKPPPHLTLTVMTSRTAYAPPILQIRKWRLKGVTSPLTQGLEPRSVLFQI